MFDLKYLLKIFIIADILLHAESITIPSSPCEDIFQYEDEFFAKITLKDLPRNYDDIEMDVDFYLQEEIDAGDEGSITSLDEDPLTVLKNGKKLNFFVVLPGFNSVPVLKSIMVNGRRICKSTVAVDREYKRSNVTTISYVSFKDSEDFSTEEEEDSYDEDTCGKPHIPKFQGLIVGGQETRAGQWPWTAAIFSTIPYKYICVGTLISHRHVITAKDCVTEQSDLLIKLGLHNLDFSDDDDTKEILSREVILEEESYSIAIIVLGERVTFTNYIKPACLPKEMSPKSKKGTVVGWGIKSSKEISSILLDAKLFLLREDCRGYNKEISQTLEGVTNIFCARANKTKPYIGDLGCGIYTKRNGQWSINGVFVYSTRRSDFSVYKNVYSFKEWILNILT